MKIFYLFAALIVSGLLHAQSTIWSEDFSYPDGTTQGSGTPAKWTINATTADVWSVQTSQIQATNIGNEAVWTSQTIDISGYSDVGLFVDVSNGGNMDGNSDYLDVSYILDGGPETFFAVNGENSSNFPNQTASQSGLSGSSVTIVVRIDNNKSNESHFFDNVIVSGNYTAVTWTGTTSNDWNIGTNWSTGVIPNVASNITIPTSPVGGNFPEINTGSGAICNNLTIETSAHVFVPADNTLTINAALTNSAGASGLVIKSDATATGSLIHNTSSVDATVEQYLTGNEWHYVSSPIADATANVFYDIYLRSFNESLYGWNDYIIDPATPLTSMLGYAAWVDGSSTTVSFEGTLNNGTTSIAVTYTPSLGNPGWNLVGNPYPSAIDWNSSTGWGDRINFYNAIYFWEGVGNGGGGNYHYFVGNFNPADPTPPIGTGDATQFIPANQAFFVKATGNTSLEVNNNARVHSTQSYWKSTEDNATPLIRMHAQNEEGLTDETIIRFHESATEEFDGSLDAYKLSGYLVPQIYSITPENTKLAINSLPTYENGSLLPIGFVAPVSGGYSVNLTAFENFYEGSKLYLEDLQADQIVELTSSISYEFSASPMDNPDRFILHFSEDLSAAETSEASVASVYAYGKTVYVNLLDGGSSATVELYNLMGQKIQSSQISGQSVQRVNVDAQRGFYVVTVRNDLGQFSSKVYIE